MWPVVTLDDIFTIARGGSPRPIDTFITDDDSGVNWIMIGDANEGSKYIESTKKKIRPEGVSRSRMVYPGDFLLTNSMSFGKPYILKTTGCIHDGWLVLSPKSNQIHPDYFYYLLGSPLIYSEFKRLAAGAVVKNLNIELAKSLNVRLPPLDDQKRIAHLLGKVEGLIAQRKQHLQQLDALLKSVFLEMFGDPVKNEKGWGVQVFSEIGKFQSGGTPSKDRPDFWEGNYPWVSPKDMKRPYIADAEDHISEKVFSETSLRRVDAGNVLIVVRGMILAHSFPVAINTVPVSINQDMKAIHPNGEVDAVYLMNCLNAMKRQIMSLITTAGHGTKKFDAFAMSELNIPVPPIALQNQFAAIVVKVEGIKGRYQQSLADLESLYGTLSQSAFAGELDLSRVPPQGVER